MKRWMRHIAKFFILSLFLLGTGALSVSANVTEGKPGQTLSGDYAVIVNTSTTATQSMGTLVFDASGNGANTVRISSASDPVGQDVVQPGMAYAAAPIAAGGTYTVGTKKSIASPYNGMRTYVCIGEGEHCYVWMEENLKSGYDAAGKTNSIAQDMEKTYDGQPYEMLNEMAGGNLPWGKLSIMLETISSASGVYKYNSEITAIHINTPAASAYEFGSMGSRNGLLVHEGQHALFRLLAKSDAYQPYTWLNEGISVAAMDYLWGGTDNNGWMDSIAGNTDIRNGSPLIYKNYRNSTAQDYGMPYLFVRYLIAQAAGRYEPMKLFPKFYAATADCAPDVYLERVFGNSIQFEDLLTNFYTAILAQESNGKYGFAGDAIVAQKVSNYPLYMGASGQAHSLEPTAAIMIHLANGSFTVPANGGDKIRYMIVSGGRSVSVPAGGDGSSGNPYVIDDFNDLALIGNKPGAHYKLANDIQAGTQSNLTVTYFSGVLDGDGHKIYGLKKPLIGRNAGTIQNLTIEAAFGGEFTGTQGMFAQVNTGLIKDCTATGTVDAKILRGQGSFSYAAFGMFAGENEVAGRIYRCETRATITLDVPASDCWIGGIAGIQTGTVKNSLSGGNITVNQSNDGCTVYVGGFAGKLESMGMGGLLSCCIHTGSITVNGGISSAGQLCGLADRSVVNSGLSTHLVNCRAKTGTIPAVGSTNAVNTKIPEDIDANVLLTEDQLKQQDSYSGWEFGSDWKMGTQGPEHFTANDIISLGTEGTPLSCYVGEQIYTWGYLTINGKRGAAITDDMVSGFDSSAPGTKNVKVSYLGKTATFSVTVKAPASITRFALAESAQKAVKKTYSVGQYFNPSGLYFLATIDGIPNRMIYSGFTYEKRPLTAADKSVTVTYYGQSVVIPITVTGKEPDSLTVASDPAKTVYAEGQKLDLSGLRMSLVYNNGEATPVFGADQLSEYGIRVVKRIGTTYTKISPTQALTSADNGASIYVCATDVMPNSSGTISKQIATLTVRQGLRVEDSVVDVVQGVKINSTISVNVSGGSRNYHIEKIREQLPSGITMQWYNPSFLYDGTATAANGSYVSQYQITDTKLEQSITAEITVRVHPSNYAELYSFKIPQVWNSNAGLTEDVVGIIDNDRNTVVLRVPNGTDVSALKISTDYGAGIGVSVPAGYGLMSVHDFREPVFYELIASDGTRRRYTVSVEFYDPANPSGGGYGGGTAGPGGSSSGGNSSSGGGSSGNSSSGGTTGAGGNSSGSNSGGGSTAGSGGSSFGGQKPVNPASADPAPVKPGNSSLGSGGTGGNSGGGQSPAAPSPVKPGNSSTAVGNNSGTGTSGAPVSSGSVSAGGSSVPSGNTGTQNNAGVGNVPVSSVVPGPVSGGGAAAVVSSVTVGTQVEQGGSSYRITSCEAETGTVELCGAGMENLSSIKVPETVQIGGRSYKVTSIAAKAFRNNRSLKQVTIGGNILSIGNQAFSGCTSLKKVVIGKSVRTIGAKAFNGCKNLKQIVVKSNVLKKVKGGAVKGIPANAVIRVPKKKKADYRRLFKRNVS